MDDRKWKANSMEDRILRSAREIEVPEGLRPEEVLKKLEALQAEKGGDMTAQTSGDGTIQMRGDGIAQACGNGTMEMREDGTVQASGNGKMSDRKPPERKSAEDEGKCTSSRQKRKRYLPYVYGICAAALLLICCSVLLRRGLFLQQTSETKEGEAAGGVPTALSGQEGAENLTEEEAAPEEAAVWQKEAPEAAKVPKQDAGELYTVASDYGEVYDLVMNSRTRYENQPGSGNWWDFLFGGGSKMDMEVEEAEAGMSANSGAMPGVPMDDSANGAPESSGEGSYSTTNLQMEGVDESDIVKTDGSYLYTVSGNEVYITDIRARQMKPAGEILFPGNASGQIRELYVSGNRLFLIASEYGSSLQKEEEGENGQVYSFDSVLETVLYTYDIENPEQPGLLGSYRQEGDYMTSRKVDDVIYLFTRYFLWDVCSSSSRTNVDWLPSVGEEKVAADHIYVPKQGENALVVSSVNQNSPDKAADHVMLVNDSAEVYVTRQSIYLYSTDYEGGTHTQVARFSLKDGSIDGVGAASVNGYVRDTFAVNESGDTFRILTTDNDGETQNCLSLFDLNLQPISSLSGIAKGEMIYAARYLGDMVYFVTYRNMDPLFAVDLSDAEHPRILGELEITGYSEYLHNWGGGQLLGIGYETDPDTGGSKGIKLSMFDISDPATLKVKDCVVLKNADWSPAMDSYKAVLADPREGLVGFLVTEYGPEIKQYYVLFDWQDASFHSLLTFSMDQGVYENNVRGLYAGDFFYIVSDGKVSCFDRLDDYQMIGQLEFGAQQTSETNPAEKTTAR